MDEFYVLALKDSMRMYILNIVTFLKCIFSAFLENGLIKGSIAETLKSREMTALGGREWAGVERALSKEDALLLGCEPGLPMLKLRRVSRAADNSVVEFVESLLDPDLFALSFDF